MSDNNQPAEDKSAASEYASHGYPSVSHKREKKRCCYCAASMPAEASVCRHCGRHQRRYLNYLRIDHVGLLIALIMMIIAYQQLGEARKERLAASQALERARGAERTATEVSENLGKVKVRVEQQTESINVIEGKARQVLTEIQAVQNLSKQAQSQAETAGALVTKVQAALGELRMAVDFYLVSLAAMSDDRQAFDQLWLWGNDNTYPFRGKAVQVFNKVVYEHMRPIWVTGWVTVPWPKDVDPSKLTLDGLTSFYYASDDIIRLGVMEFILKRTDIPKKQRLQFLVDVMKKEKSLKAMELAGLLFREESGQRIKPLYYWEFIKWWDKHKGEIN